MVNFDSSNGGYVQDLGRKDFHYLISQSARTSKMTLKIQHVLSVVPNQQFHSSSKVLLHVSDKACGVTDLHFISEMESKVLKDKCTQSRFTFCHVAIPLSENFSRPKPRNMSQKVCLHVNTAKMWTTKNVL